MEFNGNILDHFQPFTSISYLVMLAGKIYKSSDGPLVGFELMLTVKNIVLPSLLAGVSVRKVEHITDALDISCLFIIEISNRSDR